MTTSAATVSVVIATYNRAALLDECLDHLRTQNFLPGDQVIVVDNASTDATADVIERHQRVWTTPLFLLHEPHPGKSHAIARGVAEASGAVLAFTDDDVNVGDGWLDAIRAAMADPSIALTGGPVVARWEPTVPRWVRAARERHPRLGAPIALLDYGERSVDLGARTLLGANLAVRREPFCQVGGFPTHLGKLRGTLLSGEDHALCQRIQALGFRARYSPDAVVHHWVPAERARATYFLRWFFWSGITHAIMDADSGTDHDRAIAGVPRYLVRRLVSASAGLLGRLMTGQWIAAFNHAIDVAFVAGYASQRSGLVRTGEPAAVPVGDAVCR